MDWLVGVYGWTKAIHIIFVVTWMAGLLYLPRLFVYHSDMAPGSETAKTFEIMERRLLRAILNPSMVGVYIFGTALALTPGVVDWSLIWIYLKLASVAVLTGYHHSLALWRKGLADGTNRHSARYYRIANEVPTLILVGIVLLVVLKPF